jgi:biopolymer transport protein ExbD
MKISGRKDYMASLESVAMTDIVLNMFIFFFISFSLLYTFNPYRIQKLEVKLPQAANTTPIKDTAQVDITITNEGLMYLDKELVTRKELKDKVKIIYKNNPKISIMLRSDRLARFKDIVYVLDTLTEVGVKNLNIVAITEQ